jgi:hypothetical protein
MNTARLMTLILVLAAVLGAGSAQAWEFSVDICGAKLYVGRNPGADIVLLLTNMSQGYNITVPLSLDPINMGGDGSFGPFVSYQLWTVSGLSDTDMWAASIYDQAADEYIEDIGPIYSFYAGRTYHFNLGGDCRHPGVDPVRSKVLDNEVHWRQPDQLGGAIKSLPAATDLDWGSLKARYR